MGLISSLNKAMAGLVSNPRPTDIQSRPIGRPETQGVTKPATSASDASARGAAQAREAWVNRTFNTSLQSYHTRQISDAAGAEAQVHTLNRLQALFGAEGAGSLTGRFDGLQGALEALAADPEGAQTQVVAEARGMSQVLNRMSVNIADMGQQANGQMAAAAEKLNGALKSLASLNMRLQDGASRPALLEQRDRLVAAVAERIDVTAEYRDDGRVALMTRTGLALLDKSASRFSVDHSGRLLLETPAGKELELSGPNALAGGELGGLLALRDQTLVAAQAQLDDIAAGLAQAFSTRQDAGTEIVFEGVVGFDLGAAAVRGSDDIFLGYGRNGAEARVRLVNSGLPIDRLDMAGQRLIGVDFDDVDLVGVLAGKLPELDIAGGEDGGIRVLGRGRISVLSLVARTNLGGEPLFVDGAQGAFTDGVDESAAQRGGFAGRIGVDGAAALRGDAGGLLGALQAGSGGRAVGDVIVQTITTQLNVAATGLRHADDRQMVLDTVSQQMDGAGTASVSGEMSKLQDLETMFAANLRVVVIFQDLMGAL